MLQTLQAYSDAEACWSVDAFREICYIVVQILTNGTTKRNATNQPLLPGQGSKSWESRVIVHAGPLKANLL